MRFAPSTRDLWDWSARARAIRDIEGSEGFKLIMSRMKQEEEDAAQDLLRLTRWNWWRVLKSLIRRDSAATLRIYVEQTLKLGAEADNVLRQREPQAFKEAQRASFVHS